MFHIKLLTATFSPKSKLERYEGVAPSPWPWKGRMLLLNTNSAENGQRGEIWTHIILAPHASAMPS